MKLSTLLTFNAIVASIFGLTAVLVPGVLYSTYGLKSDAGAQLVAQFFGAALLGDVVLSWSLRNIEPGATRQTLTLAFFVQGAIGLVISLVAQFGAVLNALGWLNVALTAIFAVGYGYFRFMGPKTD
ncbi:MAG TPA: hypothetical protein VGS01_04070 [Candidatus Limnocylindria bacterium]|nr:hypothetical protein [Candidatus Limnocylindria bacterium]